MAMKLKGVDIVCIYKGRLLINTVPVVRRPMSDGSYRLERLQLDEDMLD